MPYRVLRNFTLIVASMFLILTPCANAQTSAADMKQANDLYQAKDWTGSAAAYGSIVKAQPTNGNAWLRYGLSLSQLHQYNEALAAYDKAVAAKVAVYNSEWAIGRTYAQMGEKDKAFEHLQLAIAAGFVQSSAFNTEPMLGSLRDDPRFAKLIDSADRAARPCDFDSHYQQFDFWLGEWEVRTASGSVLAGNSVIEKILGSCVILENWTGAGGGSGKSFNIYNTTSKQWEQIWVDAVGSLTKYSGGIKDGAMDYFADSVGPNGAPIKLHLQFFKLGPDTVRQFNQISTDGGATWTFGYDFIYTRKNAG
jgi:hypothetical protein